MINNESLLNQEGFRLISALVVLYFIVKISLLKNGSLDNSLSRFLFWGMLSTAFIEALIGIPQNYSIDLIGYSGYFRVVGTFYNPNQYAAFMSPSVPIGLALCLSEEKPFLKRLALIMVLSVVFILPVTFMRSSWLGVTVGVGTFALLKYRERIGKYFHGRTFEILTASVSLVVLLTGMVFILYKLRPSSADARILVWRVTKEMIMDRPILGVGYGNYGVRYMAYQAKFFESPENVKNYAMVAGNMKFADNDFVQIFAELGMVGILIFLLLICYAYFSSYKKLHSGELSQTSETFVIGGVGSMTTFLVISFFSFPLHIAPTAVIFFYTLAIMSAAADRSAPSAVLRTSIINSGKNIQKPEWKHWVSRFASVIIVAIMILVSWDIPQRISSYKAWDDAFTLSLNGDYDDAISLYESVYPSLNDNGKFHFMLGGTYVSDGKYREGIDELEKSKSNYNDPEIYIALGTAYEKLGDYNRAIINYEIASRMMPHWMYPHYLMAKVYYSTHDMEQAKIEVGTVINMPIKVESQAVDEMKSEMAELWKKIDTGKR